MSSNYYGLRPADPDGLRKWREDAAQREAEAAAGRRGEEQRRVRKWLAEDAEPATAPASDIEALRAEVATLQTNLVELTKEMRTVICDDVPKWIEAATRKSQHELRSLIAERFGELAGRLNAFDGTRAAKGEAFRFAGEKAGDNGEPVDLPNPLPRRDLN